MKYLCLAYEEESKFDTMSEGDWEALRLETMAYVEQIRQSGRLLAAEPLESVHTAATVRVRNGQLLTTDGPFAETKEQLGGFFMIEASNIDEAIQVAAKWPSARFGSIEVRPILDGLKPGSRYTPVR
ncbi:MAG: YciI family protein [bacterium]